MPQPVRAFADSAGDVWLVLDNGQRIQLPVVAYGAGGNGSASEDRWVDTVGDTMTGPLIQATNTSAGDKQGIEVRSPAYPALMLNKTNAPTDEHLWKVYLSGAAGSASALTFLPMADDPLGVVPAVRMYRDGRMLVGADPIADMDVVTKRYLNASSGALLQSGNTISGATAARVGPVVTLTGYFAITITGSIGADVGFLLGYVPPGFRPVAQQWFPGLWFPTSATSYRPCSIRVMPSDGAVSLFPHSAASYNTTGAVSVAGVAYEGA